MNKHLEYDVTFKINVELNTKISKTPTCLKQSLSVWNSYLECSLKSSLTHVNMSLFCLMFRYRWAGSASYLYVDVFPPRSTVYTVSSLKPSTTYNFSVNAINSMGESSYADNGAVLTVTTRCKCGAACFCWG